MSIALKWFIFITGVCFSGGVLYLLLKRKINEFHSIIWLGGVLAILLISANPGWVDTLARWVHVDYPPSLLFLVSILVLALVVLYQSVQISVLNEKLKDLGQYIALNRQKKQDEDPNPESGKKRD